jgi:hypothetical protein
VMLMSKGEKCCTHVVPGQKKSSFKKAAFLGTNGCGDKTRTCDLWVMSPTSYQLLHPAIIYS